MKNCLLCSLIFIMSFIFVNHTSALCVNVPKANLRSGPGTQYDKTWHVFKYMPFKKLSSKANWYNIQDVDGDTHWIYQKLVTDKYDCAVVKVDEANIRNGAGTNYAKTSFSPAIKYDSFKVLARKGKWVKLVDEFGNSGWVFRKLVWIY